MDTASEVYVNQCQQLNVFREMISFDLVFDGNCRQVHVDNWQRIPQSVYSVKVEMTLFVVERWVVAQFQSVRSSATVGERNV